MYNAVIPASTSRLIPLSMLTKFVVAFGAVLGCAMLSPLHAEEEIKIDFRREVQPILEAACVSCHHEARAEGDLRLDSLAFAIQGGERGTALVPGAPAKSPLYATTILRTDHEDVMPPEGPPLTKQQSENLRKWVLAGAPWPQQVHLKAQPRIDFVKHIQPILETNCLGCHSPKKAEGEFDMSTRNLAFESGSLAPNIVPFDPEDSFFYTMTVADKDAPDLMPPAKNGGPLDKDITEKIRLWISQGAVWPEKVRLQQRAKPTGGQSTPDDMELVREIHAKIKAQSDEAAREFKDYSAQIPLTKAEYQMVAIAGGEFRMGSPSKEAHRDENEGPAAEVQVDPFWMGRFEVTWDEYEPFMITQVDRHKNGARIDFDPQEHTIVDAVSQPTPPYMEMSFGMGQKGYPAISMTQHGANKYCQWLSAQTGHFYRLPTEAEWEYAARAGTTTAYSFGDDAGQLGQYAWFYDNANEKYQKVGTKKPNPWGLFDMHGNVAEWTADRYEPEYFKLIQGQLNNPFLRPTRLYPRSVRGGSWYDDPDQLRTARRIGSEAAWKQQDPQLPKSIWYHTDARWLGFRIVRPRKIPSVEEMYFYWNSATGAR